MYLKVGMNKFGELYHSKAPYSSLLAKETDMKVMVVYDPDQWPILEDKYGLRKGRIRLFTASGSLPVLLVDPNGQTRGFVLFLPSVLRLSSLVIENTEDLLPFLGLLQDLKAANANPEWVHFWIDTGKKYSDIVLSSIPNATLCEQFDYLEGSTAE